MTQLFKGKSFIIFFCFFNFLWNISPALSGRFRHFPSPWSRMYSVRILSSMAVQAPLFKSSSFEQQGFLPIFLISLAWLQSFTLLWVKCYKARETIYFTFGLVLKLLQIQLLFITVQVHNYIIQGLEFMTLRDPLISYSYHILRRFKKCPARKYCIIIIAAQDFKIPK